MSFLPEFKLEPSKPHQCIWVNEETGVRCRSYAAHNSYTCHHHIIPDMPPVFSNDEFPIERPETRESIQAAIADVLVRLAANQMDHKRAAILLYGLQIASTNLRAKPAAPPPDPPLHESVISNEALNSPKVAAEKPALSLSKAPSHFTPAQPQPATDNLQPPTCNHQPPNKNRLPRCERNRRRRSDN